MNTSLNIGKTVDELMDIITTVYKSGNLNSCLKYHIDESNFYEIVLRISKLEYGDDLISKTIIDVSNNFTYYYIIRFACCRSNISKECYKKLVDLYYDFIENS